jgi:CRISPR-associated exonuclease Cas4
VFRLCSDEPLDDWHAARIRPGSLFIVGDPKQAIYRFRGADVASYEAARRAIEREWPSNVIQITANFRSQRAILQYVNHRFAAILEARGQPGYVALTPTVVDPPVANGAPPVPCVATIAVDLAQGAATLRDTEASAVAELCDRLIGTLHVRKDDGTTALLTPGGIALLAPTGTDLWRYERALEQYGLPFASQAGKSLFRRQEVQDMVALARVLADARDHVAFGALMRGPLVGLTEEELLDATAGIPADASRPRPRFSVTTPLEHVVHPGARRALSILQDLRQRARIVTPSLVLEEAAERFLVRPLLAARERDNSARAAANVEVIIERSRGYDVKGLSAFVRDIGRNWRTNAPYTEGRADSDGDAIEIITIHSAKGLEWPVVIPINTGTQLRRREKLVHRTSDNSLHWLMGDVVPPGLAGALAADDDSQARERERLWHVACTRARDLLAIPRLRDASDASWARIVPLALHELPVIDPQHFAPRARSPDEVVPQEQTRAVFDHERNIIAAASMPVTWRRPSDYDSDRTIVTDAISPDADGTDVVAVQIPVGAGRLRGLILHKLMEEVLTGEIGDTIATLRRRAHILIEQLASLAEAGESMPLPDEVANTAARTWKLPEVAKLRPHLQAEVSVYDMQAAGATPIAIAARIDAIAIQEGRVTAVLDWKSDVAPDAADIALHTTQLRDYLQLTRVGRGALVYMTLGNVRWVDRPQ